MDGVHDLGGKDGFGPVVAEAGEPVFHAPWEGKVFALAAVVTSQKLANIHAFRHAIERMDPLHYLGSSYYEHWLTGMATLLVERGIVTPDELTTRAGGSFPLSRPARAEAVAAAAAATPDDGGAPPRFAVGAAVLVREVHPFGHTRCPDYVRGKRGTIVRVDGAFALPDVAAHSTVRRREPSYNVRFTAEALWGVGAHGESVAVDLWESYLDVP